MPRILPVSAFLLFAAAAASSAQAPAPTIPPPPDVAARPSDATRISSGLAWKILQSGRGTSHPGEDDLVNVIYTAWTTAGKVVDSSTRRGGSSTFGLKRALPGLSEGIQLMVVGEKRRFWVPQALAYDGAIGKPKGMIVFDVELLDFNEGDDHGD